LDLGSTGFFLLHPTKTIRPPTAANTMHKRNDLISILIVFS
jgi:hypothetical protein